MLVNSHMIVTKSLTGQLKGGEVHFGSQFQVVWSFPGGGVVVAVGAWWLWGCGGCGGVVVGKQGAGMGACGNV